ncbi:PA14 domain-containing protein, partial [Escherichia coli]|nr:PA14 domain-containing protein [Escherichia coli]
MEIRKYPATRIDWATLDTLRQYCDQMVTPDYTALPQGVGLTGSYYNGTNFNTFVSKRVDKVLQFDQSSGAPALGLTATSFSVRWEGKIK